MKDRRPFIHIKENYIVPFLQSIFDWVTVLLTLILLYVIFQELYTVLTVDIFGDSMKELVSDLLFILILLELFIILRQYLVKDHVSVKSIVEITILSVGREIIFYVLELSSMQLFAFSALLLVLGFIHIGEEFLYSKYNKARDGFNS